MFSLGQITVAFVPILSFIMAYFYKFNLSKKPVYLIKLKVVIIKQLIKMKFLVVDDERDVEMLFRQQLRKEIRNGLIEFDFAFSGQEALEILKSRIPPEVLYIFSDINMPGMSGLELLQKVKSEFPKIHVSMISAYGDIENYDRAIKIGAKGFFTKPLDFSTIKQEIQKMINT
ncbi:hypothetical protein GCM10026987_13700 [Belliella aquatica]|uniref:Response regulatory domain-containing protein n=2 Tax=Belliella aquatica TaxID=1323734 RepID=A0ABQ1LKE0_9BACT|nr:hypothetical protein GCM10010993_01160 [Belliella aquatica]